MGGQAEEEERMSGGVGGKERTGEEREAVVLPGPSSEVGRAAGGRGEVSDSSASICGQVRVRLVDILADGNRGRGTARRGRSSSRSRSSSLQGHRDPSLSRTEDNDADSDGSDMLFDPLHRRKRGRPPTTGDYAGLAAAKRQYLELSAAVEKMEKAQAAEQASATPPGPSRGSKPLPEEAELAAELRHLPTGDIAAQMLEHLKEVERIAGTSRNLQGGFVRKLRIAARTVAAATAEVVKRTETSSPASLLEADNIRLRMKVEDLEAELSKLKAEAAVVPTRKGARSSRGGSDSTSTAVEPMETEPVMVGGIVSPPRTRGSVRRAAPTDERTPKSSPRPERDSWLLNKIGSLVEGKLEAFRREILDRRPALRPRSKEGVPKPARAIMPSGTEGERSDAPRKKKKKKKKKKTSKGGITATETEDEPPPPQRQRPRVAKPPQAPPSGGATASEAGPRETWATVVGRKAARKKVVAPPAPKPPDKGAKKGGGAPEKAGQRKAAPKPPRLGRVPRTAAIALTVTPESTVTLGEAIASAKKKLTLAEVGLEALTYKRAVTGGLLMQIPGPEGAAKADTLAKKLEEALQGTGVKITRPCKRAELRVTGLDDSVTPAEVADAIAAAGACRPEEVRTGQIRSSSSGLGTLWVSCPLLAANTVAKAGRIRVGWASARVEVLAARPLQCYRCLQVGHVRQRCTGDVDRSGRCYNCGASGHTAGKCPAETPNCPLCADLGRPAGHRLGSKACSPPTRKKKGARKEAPAAAAATEVGPARPPTEPTGPEKEGGQGEAMAIE
ncbi:hypothetical protein ANTQUA_LOCUS10541 [Anthophora quadrimaculata]